MCAGRVKSQIICHLCKRLTALWEAATSTALPYLSFLQCIPHTHTHTTPTVNHRSETTQLRNKTAQLSIIHIILYCTLLLLNMGKFSVGDSLEVVYKFMFIKKKIIRPLLKSLNYFVDCIAISFNISMLRSA